jgi:hypothetical protein
VCTGRPSGFGSYCSVRSGMVFEQNGSLCAQCYCRLCSRAFDPCVSLLEALMGDVVGDLVQAVPWRCLCGALVSVFLKGMYLRKYSPMCNR